MANINCLDFMHGIPSGPEGPSTWDLIADVGTRPSGVIRAHPIMFLKRTHITHPTHICFIHCFGIGHTSHRADTRTDG
jgi:hypothetical protein